MFPRSAGDSDYHGDALEPLQFKSEHPVTVHCVPDFLSADVVKAKADVADRTFVLQALEFFN